MKIKFEIDLGLSPRTKTWSVRLGAPLAVLAAGGVAYASGWATWSDGQTIKAADLNGNFTSLQNQISALGDAGAVTQAQITALQSASASAQAQLSNVVDLTSNQNIGGLKNFVYLGPDAGGAALEMTTAGSGPTNTFFVVEKNDYNAAYTANEARKGFAIDDNSTTWTISTNRNAGEWGNELHFGTLATPLDYTSGFQDWMVLTAASTNLGAQANLLVSGYVQLAATTGSPPAGDCNSASQRGRMKVDTAAGALWICMNAGWAQK